MFSLRFLILLVMWVQKSYSTVLKGSDLGMQNDLQRVVHRLIDPIRTLSDVLPHHAIELQVEYVQSRPSNIVRLTTKPPRILSPQMQFLRMVNKPYPYGYSYHSGNPYYRPAVRSKNKEQPASAATTTQAPTTQATTKAPEKQATTTECSDPKKRPVNLEDLEKALSEFEKRLMSNQLPIGSSLAPVAQGNPTVPQTQSVVIQGSFDGSPNQNIDDIMQLLKRGIQVERNVPRPTDENLDWLEIRIPK